jgi:hypothetical protein
MAVKTLDSLASRRSDLILCYYLNASSHIQIVSSEHLASWSFERVVFPGQRLLFEAPPDAYLELYTSQEGKLELIAKTRCDRLGVDQGLSSSFKSHAPNLVKELLA